MDLFSQLLQTLASAPKAQKAQNGLPHAKTSALFEELLQSTLTKSAMQKSASLHNGETSLFLGKRRLHAHLAPKDVAAATKLRSIDTHAHTPEGVRSHREGSVALSPSPWAHKNLENPHGQDTLPSIKSETTFATPMPMNLAAPLESRHMATQPAKGDAAHKRAATAASHQKSPQKQLVAKNSAETAPHTRHIKNHQTAQTLLWTKSLHTAHSASISKPSNTKPRVAQESLLRRHDARIVKDEAALLHHAQTSSKIQYPYLGSQTQTPIHHDAQALSQVKDTSTSPSKNIAKSLAKPSVYSEPQKEIVETPSKRVSQTIDAHKNTHVRLHVPHAQAAGTTQVKASQHEAAQPQKQLTQHASTSPQLHEHHTVQEEVHPGGLVMHALSHQSVHTHTRGLRHPHHAAQSLEAIPQRNRHDAVSHRHEQEVVIVHADAPQQSQQSQQPSQQHPQTHEAKDARSGDGSQNFAQSQQQPQNFDSSDMFDSTTETAEAQIHHFDEQALEQLERHRARTIQMRIDQTLININMTQKQVAMHFVSTQPMHIESDLGEVVDAIMKESGYERYKITLKDKERRVVLAQEERSSMHSDARSGVNVKV